MCAGIFLVYNGGDSGVVYGGLNVEDGNRDIRNSAEESK